MRSDQGYAPCTWEWSIDPCNLFCALFEGFSYIFLKSLLTNNEDNDWRRVSRKWSRLSLQIIPNLIRMPQQTPIYLLCKYCTYTLSYFANDLSEGPCHVFPTFTKYFLKQVCEIHNGRKSPKLSSTRNEQHSPFLLAATTSGSVTWSWFCATNVRCSQTLRLAMWRTYAVPRNWSFSSKSRMKMQGSCPIHELHYAEALEGSPFWLSYL